MLVYCPECELQVSDKAYSCPHCGYPLKSNMSRPYKSSKRKRLPNGFGQISEIKGKYLRKPFRAMVSIGKSETGRPICKPLQPNAYFETYNDAYAALVEYNRNPYDLSPAITMKELYEKWLEKYVKTNSNYSTISNFRSAWNYCSMVYDMKVVDLRARHVKICIEEGTFEGRSPSAAIKSRVKSLFNMMLDYAVEYEIVDRNYARTFSLSEDVRIESEKVNKEHVAFTDEEIEKLWKYVGKIDGIDLILIQCYSGWRPQELGLIELGDLNMSDWTFKGGMKTKAGIGRVVPIHSKIRKLVKHRYDEAVFLGSKYLFNSADIAKNGDTFLTYKRYKSLFGRVVKNMELNPNHRPHDPRKHFVTMAKKCGMDEYAIKYVVGHAINDITEKVYTERDPEWLRTEMEKIR